MEKEFDGEYAASVVEKKYLHIICARIVGTEEEIRLTTDEYCRRFPIETYKTTAWGDAFYLHHLDEELYFELLLFRLGEPSGR